MGRLPDTVILMVLGKLGREFWAGIYERTCEWPSVLDELLYLTDIRHFA
jgi:hypothetical protein